MATLQRWIGAFLVFVFLVGCNPSDIPVNPSSITPQFPQPTLSDNKFAVLPTMTEISQPSDVCKDIYAYQRYSPNGKWLEKLCYSEIDNGLIMTLSNSESKTMWKVLYQDYIPHTGVIADGEISVTHWSNDGRYAYFSSYSHGSGGECYVLNTNSGLGLFRIDLQNGNITHVLPLNDNSKWYGFSFSPTDQRLVYLNYKDHEGHLKILQLATGESISISSVRDFNEGGGFLWSQDELRLVYSTVWYKTISEPTYSLRLVDIQSGNERILLESPRDCFTAISWTDNNVLVLTKNYNESLVEFDLNSNSIISESTTTP